MRGSFTVPSYVVPVDPSPLEQERDIRQMLKEQFPQFAAALDAFNDVPRQAYTVSTPPNRLFYNPADSPNPSDPEGQRYGDGLPDSIGEMTTTFTCRIPKKALDDPAGSPSRPIVYGHGLLGGQEERGPDQDYNLTYCKIDWFGFAFGDIPNVVTALLDMSNFPVIPDASQQGMLNFMFLARLLRHPDGFVSDPAFRKDGQPLFDNREVFYDGNSQGGILGGVVLAMSKDITRGVLGVVGMNYSTLLQRSVDFDAQFEPGGLPPYSLPVYLSYQDDLDRQLMFSIIQMLWDRSENNGYAHHITNNAALKGPNKQVLLQPAFADHQVSHWSAQVMARTVGVDVADMYQRKPGECSGDVTHCFTDKFGFFAQRDPDSADFLGLPLVGRDTGAAYDTAGCTGSNCRTTKSAFVEFDEGMTAAQPIGNVPNRADGFDPHGYPRGTIFGRCQKSHFLHSQGRVIDVRGVRNVTSAENCPALPVNTGSPAGGGTPATAVPDYGTGVLGALAQLMSRLHDIIVALVTGDLQEAGAQLVAALTELGDGLTGVVGQANPARPATTIIGLDQEPLDAFTRATSANRDVEPVMLTGAQIPGWSQLAAAGIAQNHFSGFENFTGATEPGNGPRNAHAGVFLYPANWVPGDVSVNTGGGAPVNEIAAYAYRDGRWGEIPVQVDERYPYFLANGNSTFSFYSGIDQELTYAWDTESWGMTKGTCNREYDPNGIDVDKPGLYTPLIPDANPNQGVSKAIVDPIAGLDNDDEVVFMASDAGSLAPFAGTPPGATAVQLIALVDPLLAGGDAATIQNKRFVYLVRQPGGSAFNKTNGYVKYERHPNADQWIDRSFFEGGRVEDDIYDRNDLGTSNTNYGSNLDGTVCDNSLTTPPTPLTPRAEYVSQDRFPRDGVTVSTDQYRWEATGRWMIRDIRIKDPDDALDPDDTVANANYWRTRPDLIDRWKGRAFQQSPDSTISVVGFEDEQVNWEANSTLLGERHGAVRAIREVWGADSGTNVTKTETFYRNVVTSRYHVRVHPIPPDGLYTSWDYNRKAMISNDPAVPGGRYYTVLRPQGVSVDGVNDDVGQVDVFPGCRQFHDSPAAGTLLPVLAAIAGSIEDITDQIPFVGVPDPYGLQSCAAFFDAADPTFNLTLAFDNWEQVSGKGNSGSLVYTFEMKGATSLANPLVVPYYRDDECLDDGTGDDPQPRVFPGEASYKDTVKNAYAEQAIKHVNQLECKDKQGAYAAHGIHYFVTHDTDNATAPVTTTEIDGQQWQFMVPTNAPQNVAEPYANIVRVPLQALVVPLTPPSGR